jgi:hypothetical protein
MRKRPIRPFIYKPVLWFGIQLNDWAYIGLLVSLAYSVPFFFEWKIFGLPASLIFSLVSFSSSVGFFNWARLGRKPHWLQHTLQQRLRAFGGTEHCRRQLPGETRRCSWLIEE